MKETARNALHKKLTEIKKVFPINTIVTSKPTVDSIAKYYRINKLAYKFFHSKDDFIHMGISRDGTYTSDDLIEPARIVEKYITTTKAKNILELAAGKGANSHYLAQHFPKTSFFAVDLPNGQFDIAINKNKNIKNFHPSEGDYHDLRQYKANSFDVVFVIEALCYSMNKEKVLREVKRVLKPRGLFIVMDGYSKKPEKMLTTDEQLAKKLIERGMMLEDLVYYKEFIQQIAVSKFSIIHEEDVTAYVLPSLERFEKRAKLFFHFPTAIQKLFVKILPAEFVNNVLSAYLMATLSHLGVADYEVTVMKKE
jgi:ubiquinone/menaquinone biosynthesis C-methylase UbiE